MKFHAQRSPCVAPEAGRLCGRPSVMDALVNGVACALCRDHAEELDRDRNALVHRLVTALQDVRPAVADSKLGERLSEVIADAEEEI